MASSRTHWEIAQPMAAGAGHPEQTSRIMTDLFSAWIQSGTESETLLIGIRDERKLCRGRAIVKQRPYERRPTKGTAVSS